jgi:hypothetical protein
MVDKPGRHPPRFPDDQVDRVLGAIESALGRWNVGPQTTLICGAARGTDILAAEAARRRGAKLHFCLALPPTEFIKESVAIDGTDWADRFHELLPQARVEVLDSGTGSPAPSTDIYARTNDWILDTAQALSPDHFGAIVVWNGQRGDGPGGTAHFVSRVKALQKNVTIVAIDPTPRLYESRQTSPGPKRLLALDGGGIRGALSLQILGAIERQLRKHYRNDDLVLSDYFDYIAGTSTGAIIATGLALGKPISFLQEAYAELGSKVFTKRMVLERWRSLYKENLSAQLNSMYGQELSLGDPSFRSLLLVVLHNTITDSPWPLSNCTEGKYNRADRFLETCPDRNLDLNLTRIVRGSTAAPMFFPPESIKVGNRDFIFQDGGITPYNNPALIIVLMAALPEYCLEWETGPEKMLLVSIGTGASEAVHPGVVARKVNAIFNARNLPSVFMNGASISQDLVCRSLGVCRAGPEIDREVGTRRGRTIPSQPLFTYLRYDADLSAQALRKAGITDPHTQKAVRKLDSVGSLRLLRKLGDRVGSTVDIASHFEGFLGPL